MRGWRGAGGTLGNRGTRDSRETGETRDSRRTWWGLGNFGDGVMGGDFFCSVFFLYICSP